LISVSSKRKKEIIRLELKYNYSKFVRPLPAQNLLKMIKGRVIQELQALRNLLYTTVRIVTYDENGNEDGVGTGFFYHFADLGDFDSYDSRVEALITNKHVIEGAHKGKIVLHLEPLIDGFPTGVHEFEIDQFESKFIQHPEPDIDLCALKIDPYIREVEKKTGQHVHYQALTFWQTLADDELKQMFPISDVYMVGYPEGMWDEKNNLPISRKGVTASHPYFDFNEKSQGVVDIATFQGSSGSPIITYHPGEPRYDGESETKFELLGILWGAAQSEVDGKLVIIDIPTKRSRVPRTNVTMHLGYYVKAKELSAFEPLLIKSSGAPKEIEG
jgi:hypothetical protein